MDRHTLAQLPELPEPYFWDVLVAKHNTGTTAWLRIMTNHPTEAIVTSYGWRTGYIPNTQHIINRARKMFKDFRNTSPDVSTPPT